MSRTPDVWRQRWNAGEPYNCSSDLADQLTYGYGALGSYGTWEFPMPDDFANAHAAENRARWQQLRVDEERAYALLDRAFGQEWRV